MIVTVMRTRFLPDGEAEYMKWASRTAELARAMPGYISHKVFVAEDGERLTYVEFESEEALRGWASHPEHVQVKKLGRTVIFSEYRVLICKVIRETSLKPKIVDAR
jgi:heme-degrading monooxygenase HmoA